MRPLREFAKGELVWAWLWLAGDLLRCGVPQRVYALRFDEDATSRLRAKSWAPSGWFGLSHSLATLYVAGVCDNAERGLRVPIPLSFQSQNRVELLTLEGDLSLSLSGGSLFPWVPLRGLRYELFTFGRICLIS